MDDVYKFADCNIAATSGSSSSHGCFSTRDPYLVETFPVFLGFYLPDLPLGHYRLLRTADYDLDVPGGTLKSRAWVMQEKVLSRRVLQFTNRQVYFKCNQGITSEAMPHGRPQQNSRALVGFIDRDFKHQEATNTGALHDSLDVLYRWHKLVGNYSACDLTQEGDKLVALSRLAKEVRRNTGWTYAAGLWKEEFAIQLLWFTLPRLKLVTNPLPTELPCGLGPRVRGKSTLLYVC
jgi:hypothetical protein